MFSPNPNFGFIYVLKRFATALVASMCLHFGFSPYLGGFLFSFSTQDLWVQLVLKPMQVGSVMVIASSTVKIQQLYLRLSGDSSTPNTSWPIELAF